MADLAGTASRAKIKGGRWTVARFFMVSMAYTSAWLAVCSQLDYFRSLYGPQVLLQLNIAYYLPTVPLLVVSSFLDRFLDRKLGVARTILVRILVGLLGYAGLCIWLPFQPARLRLLLGTAVGMGLFSGLAFSASYQLVSRFANKNVIALGLGCSASAPLVLLMELAFGIGTHATSHEQRLLYCSVGVIVVTGTAAAISLLLRHWDAVESHASGRMGKDGVADATAEEGSAGAAAATAPAVESLGTQRTAPLEIGSAAASDDEAAESTPTPLPPPLIAYGSLEPYRTFLSTDEEVHDADGSFHGPTPRELSRLDSNLKLGDRSTSFRRGSSHEAASGSAPEELAPLLGGAAEQEPGALEGERVTRAVLTRIWAPLLCMFVSSAIALTIFPFFTYVPSSGLFGETFPRVLFFARVFADILGRLSPRASCAAASSPAPVLAVTAVKFLAMPIFFAYLRAPERYLSDVAAVVFIAFLWLIGGWINTNANLLAPKMVPGELKGTAAAFMAIAYQTAHFVGLALAAGVALLLFGNIAP